MLDFKSKRTRHAMIGTLGGDRGGKTFQLSGKGIEQAAKAITVRLRG